jgi:hypothetical protein
LETFKLSTDPDFNGEAETTLPALPFGKFA